MLELMSLTDASHFYNFQKNQITSINEDAIRNALELALNE
jgi:hypothetical protein